MTKQISITIEEELLTYLDELADINGRSRSGMIAWLISRSKVEDDNLEAASKEYEELQKKIK